MNSLIVCMRHDGDDAAEMSVEIVAGQFCGRGSAWFSVQGLSQSLRSFEMFPIDATNAPNIVGGYWSDDASNLAQEHVHISARPLDGRGNLIMTVKAFTPSIEYSEKGLGQGVHCDYFVSYEGLKEFCEKMRALISGEASRIEFSNFY